MKVWSIVLWIVAAAWAIEGVAIWFGYEPSRFSISVAFIITATTVAKWAGEAWTGKE